MIKRRTAAAGSSSATMMNEIACGRSSPYVISRSCWAPESTRVSRLIGSNCRTLRPCTFCCTIILIVGIMLTATMIRLERVSGELLLNKQSTNMLQMLWSTCEPRWWICRKSFWIGVGLEHRINASDEKCSFSAYSFCVYQRRECKPTVAG
jgi:hypothetical protein